MPGRWENSGLKVSVKSKEEGGHLFQRLTLRHVGSVRKKKKNFIKSFPGELMVLRKPISLKIR